MISSDIRPGTGLQGNEVEDKAVIIQERFADWFAPILVWVVVIGTLTALVAAALGNL